MKKIISSLLLVPLCIDGLAQSMVPKAPKLNLDSYILIEASTNTVIAEFNSDNQIFDPELELFKATLTRDLIDKVPNRK